jgi:hypothetical protein
MIMMNLVAAALAATAAPTTPQPADAHAQHQQMGHEQGSAKPAMKDCCCKDKMAKMDSGPGPVEPQKPR